MKNRLSQIRGILTLMILVVIGCMLAFASAESAVVDDVNHTKADEQNRADSYVEDADNSNLSAPLTTDTGAQDSEDVHETQDDDTEDEHDEEREDDCDEDDASESNDSLNELYSWIGRIVAAFDDWNEEYTPFEADDGYGYDDYDEGCDSQVDFERDQGCCCRGCGHCEDYMPRDFSCCKGDREDEAPRHHVFLCDGQDFRENRDDDDEASKGRDPRHDGNDAFDMIR